MSESQITKIREIAQALLDEKVAASDLDKQLLSDHSYSVSNLQKQAEMLKWAGISFGQQQVMLLQKSIKQLAKLSGAVSLKLFGKIYGINKDYWIVSGQLPKGWVEEPARGGQEKRGQGANTTIFWVTDNLLNDWIQLPDVRPEQVMVARMIKYMFTGDLNATIDSCPPFPGKERHLLRAQLARLTHATELCPKGSFEVDEETNEVKAAEEPPAVGLEELKSLEAWSHLHPIIYHEPAASNGKCTQEPTPGLGEEDAAAEADAFEKVKIERFRDLAQDEGMDKSETP